MNKRPIAAGLLSLCAAALAGCGLAEQDAGASVLKLPECSGKDTVFESLSLESARSVYHSTVARVVRAHIDELADVNTKPLQCTANDYRGLLQPSSELTFLADQLPEWGPSRGTLSEADMGAVLLEYLRVYECALHQRERFILGFVQDEKSVTETRADGTEIDVIDRLDLTEEQQRQKRILAEEYMTARPALERTIAFLGGVDRLRPLSAELECLKRASLDLRNVTGLMAETASCMPKIWDARGSLRDTVEDENE